MPKTTKRPATARNYAKRYDSVYRSNQRYASEIEKLAKRLRQLLNTITERENAIACQIAILHFPTTAEYDQRRQDLTRIASKPRDQDTIG